MTLLINQAEIQRAYSLLVSPDQVVEVRALEALLRDDRPYYKQTVGGFFDNVTDLVKALQRVQQAQGIYITIQELDPDLLHRAKNKIIALKKDYSTPDKNVKRYRWLPLDFDISREVKNISSNDEEHQRALAHAQKVKHYLLDRGWPAPVEADSGNGAHLLLPVDLPVNEETNGLMHRVLTGIAAATDTAAIMLDQTVYNPARIWKLYGTLVCKGDNTPERPHRMSRLLETPSPIRTISREELEVIATVEHVPTVHPTHTLRKFYEKFTAAHFIQKHNIGVKSEDSYQGGTRYHLEVCSWDSNHTDNSAIIVQYADGRLAANCSHDGCEGKGWKDFRVMYEPDAYAKAKKKAEDTETEEEPGTTTAKEPSAQTRLMEIAKHAKFLNTASGALYARVPVNGHHEVVSINEKGSGFRRWLVYQFHQQYGYVPNSDALSQTMGGIQAIAEYEGERAKVYTRIAEKNGRVYLDLANEKWECIEISQDDWRVISCPPVYFRRPSGMLPLPLPQRGGDLKDLRKLINASSDKDYVLITSWLVGALHPTGPYPVLNLNGERGSAKSKTTTILRNLIDPNEAPTRNAPKDDRDAAVAAQNNMVIALDNLSSMPLWLSDVLCRIATGSGFATREMYSDDSERVFSAKRPILLNGIEDGLISQGDLLNRTMLVTLEPPSTYRSEEELDDLFKSAHPRLLGALLSIAAQALRNRKKVQIDNPPRMADFARWMTAAEPALKWEPGAFLCAYRENQENSSSIIVESSPVAKAIIQFMENHPEKWEGLTKDLLVELQKYDVFSKAKTTPKTPNRLSGQLKRIAPSLRVQGLDIQQPPRQKDGSHVILLRIASNIAGVDQPLSGVDQSAFGVDQINQSTPVMAPASGPVYDKNNRIGVDGVDQMPYLSISHPLVLSEKERENRVKPDREGNLSTPSTLSTPTEEMKAEFRQLYARLKAAVKDSAGQQKIAPLGTLYFGGMSSGIEPGNLPVGIVMKRLVEIYQSEERQQLDYALQQMSILLERRMEGQ